MQLINCSNVKQLHYLAQSLQTLINLKQFSFDCIVVLVVLTVACLFQLSLSWLNQKNRFVLWEPFHLILFQLRVNDRLYSVEITRVFKFQVDNKVNVVPNIVVVVNVVIKSFLSVAVKLKWLVETKYLQCNGLNRRWNTHSLCLLLSHLQLLWERQSYRR